MMANVVEDSLSQSAEVVRLFHDAKHTPLVVGIVVEPSCSNKRGPRLEAPLRNSLAKQVREAAGLRVPVSNGTSDCPSMMGGTGMPASSSSVGEMSMFITGRSSLTKKKKQNSIKSLTAGPRPHLGRARPHPPGGAPCLTNGPKSSAATVRLQKNVISHVPCLKT